MHLNWISFGAAPQKFNFSDFWLDVMSDRLYADNARLVKKKTNLLIIRKLPSHCSLESFTKSFVRRGKRIA